MASAAPEVSVVARDAAFERLYRRYVRDVYRYSLALLRNPADAEDVTQTTFMNAYRAMQRGEQPRKPQHWLIKIAHNAARSRYARSTRRVKEVPLEEHVDAIPVPDHEKPDLREVLEALGRLPLNQRAALVMRELEGRSYAEIADTIGVSVPAVETLIFRARRSLKLKAPNLRVLGLAPLPPSLAQLPGGGAVAGGSAALGSSFVLKAAVAVVAGAVATGIVGSRRDAGALAAHAEQPVAAPSWSGVGSTSLRGKRRATGAQPLRNARSKGHAGTARPPSHAPAAVGGERPAVAAAEGSTAGASVAATPQPARSAPTTVQQVVSSVPIVNQVVSSLPVTVPPVSVPVPLPPVPALPALPEPPAVPQLPHLP